ncbi:sugar phosphate nucleotidyltransferase [Numidum massiliense]|uniref:sugar phosphate nucleotidyltransferase n=1 Tax=Numidum massiliense TaxID=1522315 RepID=UPI0006D54FA6|nr:sugar phosphate nucleotidyltransferase [Numidum massiliense]
MKLILLSGGSGKRLWPLSNDSRSKQFLHVLKNEQGELESMVQRVWKQLQSCGLNESTVIATSKNQVDAIENQLGTHVPLIIEPERRDTFPAIALAATYLYSVAGASLDTVVGILPVDPYVEGRFYKRVVQLEQVLRATDAEIALIGVKPTYPSAKYGYIVPQKASTGVADAAEGAITVSHFKEKPSEEVAAALINEEQALWNCGVFAFKLEYIISLLEKEQLPLHYEELIKQYNRLPRNSFDYEVVEKAKRIVALSYDGDWKDLGTWNTLTEEMGTALIGRGVVSADSRNTHLINELDIPVAVLGVSDAVVAVSPDGILVTDKEKSPAVKDIIAGLNQRPMYEERRWGSYKVLDYKKTAHGMEVLTRRIGMKSGKHIRYEQHLKRSAVWTIVEGEGELVLEGEIKRVVPGDTVQIPIAAKHGIKALSELEFVEVLTGRELVDESGVTIYDTWEEVEKYCHYVSN